LLVDFELAACWSGNAMPQPLTAIYYLSGNKLEVAVTDQPLSTGPLAPGAQFSSWMQQHRLLIFDPAKPLQLEPAQVPKPWGREIWYSGIERRAVCAFSRGDARAPIPWLQAVAPADAVGIPGQPLVLLKVLDPLPQPVLGELYFELHESKREVYVVTGIDRQAWPDGVGYIRYGFDPALLADYTSDDRFRADYLAAVQAYERQRRALDRLPEKSVAADSAQTDRERMLRERMNRFTWMRPLRVGDVVTVPPLLPHALQHGVRVVEFQTPVYERKILSFGQKVVTQAHWDTREAVACMKLIPPAQIYPAPLLVTAGVLVEQIAAFPDFEVLRTTLQPGASWRLDCEHSYCLIMVVSGVLDVAGTRCGPERALLLPRLWSGLLACAETAPVLEILLARPCR
jgi:hypothetical protein